MKTHSRVLVLKNTREKQTLLVEYTSGAVKSTRVYLKNAQL